jgi:hypothetical protein
MVDGAGWAHLESTDVLTSPGGPADRPARLDAPACLPASHTTAAAASAKGPERFFNEGPMTRSDDKAVRELIDREQIRELIFQYAFHLDMNHPKELADLFVEDCSVIYGPNFGAEGRAAYLKTLDGIGSFFQATSHHVSNIVIEFKSDSEAAVRSVLYAWHRYRKERPDGILFGQYHDVMVKVGDEWKFKRRELRTTGAKDFHVKEMIPIGRA